MPTRQEREQEIEEKISLAAKDAVKAIAQEFPGSLMPHQEAKLLELIEDKLTTFYSDNSFD